MAYLGTHVRDAAHVLNADLHLWKRVVEVRETGT